MAVVEDERRVVIVGGAGRNNVAAMTRLQARKNWRVVHWFVQQRDQIEDVVRAFPESEAHWVRDAVRRRLPDRKPYRDWPIRDVEVVRATAGHDPIIYPVFLRESRLRSGMDQLAEYHELLTLWHYFFDYATPDLLIFTKIPAHMHDVLAYYLALDRGIPILFLMGQFHMPGVWLPANQFEQEPPRIASRYRELIASGTDDIELSESWEQFLKRMTGTYEDSMYRSFGRRYSVSQGSDRIRPRDTIPWKIYRYLLRKPPVPTTRLLAREVLMGPSRARLRTGYSRLTTEPDYGRKYVFVPLHVQPERTSIPQGGVFGHQLLMIEMLAESIPDDWEIYVKEHPVQLYDTPGHHSNFRTVRLYKEVLRIPKVRLVPALVSSRNLVEHCTTVAAVTSTVCWEAFFQRKPSLVFGHVWFSFCHGIFHTPTLEACKEAIRAVEHGVEIHDRHLRACIRSVQDEAMLKPPSLKGSGNVDSGIGDENWEKWLSEFDRQVDNSGMVVPL